MDSDYLKHKSKNFIGNLINIITPLNNIFSMINDDLIPDHFIGDNKFVEKDKKRMYKCNAFVRAMGRANGNVEDLSEQEIHDRLVIRGMVKPNQNNKTKRIIKSRFYESAGAYWGFKPLVDSKGNKKYNISFMC